MRLSKALKMSRVWVTLNVGGIIMETNISTVQSVPDSMLSKMFNHENLAPIKDGAYLNDADPDVFTVILDWLHHRKVMLVPAVVWRGKAVFLWVSVLVVFGIGVWQVYLSEEVLPLPLSPKLYSEAESS
jgi:hypothetical protein